MRWIAIAILIVTLILVPFFLFESYFNDLAARAASGETSTATAALILGGLLSADVVLPVPSSIVSAAAGALLGFWRGTAVVWIGMTISCALGYAIGARSSSLARRFVGEEGLARAGAAAARYGDLAVVLARPVPVLAEASVIFAGLTGMRKGRFVAICALSNLGVALVYGAVGAFSMRMESFLLTFLGALALPGIAALIGRLFVGRASVPSDRAGDSTPRL